MKHNFVIEYVLDGFGQRFICKNCADPEPETVNYIWLDSNNDVYFDSDSLDKLFLFLAQHDAFKLASITS